LEKNLKKKIVIKPLRRLPRDKAFYFFTSIGNYTGKSAASLAEFLTKIKEVDVKSLEFHLYRGDFEKWVTEVLEDVGLAKEIRGLRALNLMGEPLRKRLSEVVAAHYRRLKAQLRRFELRQTPKRR